MHIHERSEAMTSVGWGPPWRCRRRRDGLQGQDAARAQPCRLKATAVSGVTSIERQQKLPLIQCLGPGRRGGVAIWGLPFSRSPVSPRTQDPAGA